MNTIQLHSGLLLPFQRKGLRSMLALLPLLGVTYILGYFLQFHIAVQYLFVLLNSTQVCCLHQNRYQLTRNVRTLLPIIQPSRHLGITFYVKTKKRSLAAVTGDNPNYNWRQTQLRNFALKGILDVLPSSKGYNEAFPPHSPMQCCAAICAISWKKQTPQL